MKIYVDFSALHQLAHRVGEPAATFQLTNNPRHFDPIVIGDGREVPISDVSMAGGLLSYKGRQVVLYIKDHSYNFDRVLNQASLGNKFHLAHCSTLDEMIERKRYERYVVKNSVDRQFTISTSRPPERQAQVPLQVCKNCLTTLNYQAYKNEYAKRASIVANFNLNQFFATYSSCFSHLPSGVETSSVNYSENWAELSRQTRESRQFSCADCGVNCSTKPHLSHVHHINGVKRDNSLENLEVLCADCHRKEHQDFMYVSHNDMRAINQLRTDQNLMECSWQSALRLCDPALLGDLNELKAKGWAPPRLHYRIDDNQDTIVDAAWPEQKIALCLWPIKSLSGWTMLRFRQSVSAS